MPGNNTYEDTKAELLEQSSHATKPLITALDKHSVSGAMLAKIIKLRHDEYKYLYGKNYKIKRQTLVAAIKCESELVEILHTLTTQELNGNFDKSSSKNKAITEPFYITKNKIVDELKILVLKMLQNPPHTVSKDITMLHDIASNLSKFMEHPHRSAPVLDLMESSKLLYKKMGPVWHGIKAALAATIGVMCIITGTIGLPFSFGISAGLISVGTLLCTAAGLSQFKYFKPQLTSAKNISKDVTVLLNQANSIFHKMPKQTFAEPKKEHEEIKRSTVSLTNSNS